MQEVADKERQTRRGRRISEGRDKRCPYCQRSYFRINSLAFHIR